MLCYPPPNWHGAPWKASFQRRIVFVDSPSLGEWVHNRGTHRDNGAENGSYYVIIAEENEKGSL